MHDAIARLNVALKGRYRVERELGEGGTANVYLADDLRHERRVALKVLKPELAAVVGADRFLAEIKTTAHLQHPHILPLFDSGEADSFLFYVMPHVEGESLRKKLDREHQLPVEEALHIATAVAGALDYAHRHGVIHRDIKPANILLHDDEPVISDFGIALAMGVAGAARLTETGLSLGTPHYMSPEQATGDVHIGVAADVFALGCVVYEMLVGDPPYMGSTPQAILGKIIAGECASVRKERPSVPTHVDAAVRKALEKVPADRFVSAWEFSRALTDPSVMASAAARGPNRTPRHVAAATIVALLLGAFLGWALKPSPEREVRHWAVSFPANQTPGLRTGGISILPDGSGIVYAVADTLADADLYLRRFDALEGRPLPGTDRAWAPQVSPDGLRVAFDEVGIGGLRIVSLDGGPRFAVTDSLNATHSWGPDGMIYSVHSVTEGLGRVPATGGPVETLTSPDVNYRHFAAHPLPTGNAVVFTIARTTRNVAAARIAVWSAEAREVKVLTSGFWARYTPSGHLLFVRPDGRLYAAPFDTHDLELTAAPVPVVDDVAFDHRGIAAYDLSASGTLVYVRGGALPFGTSAVWVDRSGTEHPTLIESWDVANPEPRLAPDGFRVAYVDGDGDVWVFDLRSGAASRVTYDGAVDGHVGWSPDGGEVLFPSGSRLYAKRVDGSDSSRLLLEAEPFIDEAAWSPDGDHLVMELWDQESAKGMIVYAGPGTEGTLRRIGEGTAIEDFPELSPDGRWLAYTVEGPEYSEVWVRPFLSSGGAWQVSRNGGTCPLWSHSGNELFYVAGDSVLMAARISMDGDLAVEGRARLFDVRQYNCGNDRTIYGVSPDDQRFFFTKNADLYAGGAVGSAEVIVVENFIDELKRAVRN